MGVENLAEEGSVVLLASNVVALCILRMAVPSAKFTT